VKSSARTDEAAVEALDRLCARHSLGVDQRERLLRLLHAVAADPHAPTAIRDPAAAVDLHIADSLAGLEIEPLTSAATIADLGSGAGFPGLPLSAALPRAQVTLIESQGRKCSFLARAAELAGIENATVLCRRVEEWSAGACGQDAVVARALAPPSVVAEYAAPLLRAGGALVDWRGRRDEREERGAIAAAAELGLRLDHVRKVQPFADAKERHLYVYFKVSETPSRFPRRAGIARKRPLGSERKGSAHAAADRGGR
jgi:16S rRNA (guanine527-N7)-methyltransferase